MFQPDFYSTLSEGGHARAGSFVAKKRVDLFEMLLMSCGRLSPTARPYEIVRACERDRGQIPQQAVEFEHNIQQGPEVV